MPPTDNSYAFSCGLLDMLDGYSEDPLIHATLDDVGTCGNDGMCAVVGYVAYKPCWDMFNSAWKRVREGMGLEYLHTSEYLYKYLRVGDHSPTDDEVYKCLEPFITVIHNQLIRPGAGFGVSVITRCDAYEQLTADERRYIRPPDMHSFEMAVGLACKQVKYELSDENTIAVQMDEAQTAPALYERYQAMKRENDTLKSYLGAICFADDTKHQPVQAADMLGHLTLRAWRSHQADEDSPPSAYRNLIAPEGRGSVHRIVYGIKALRRVAQMRKERADRMIMPLE